MQNHNARRSLKLFANGSKSKATFTKCRSYIGNGDGWPMHVSMKYLCGPKPHIMDRGMRIMHGLQVQWQNIRQVVMGAHEGPYKAPIGARGCDRLGVTWHVWQCDNRDGSSGTGEGDAGIDRTRVGWVYMGVYESVDWFITAPPILQAALWGTSTCMLVRGYMGEMQLRGLLGRATVMVLWHQ